MRPRLRALHATMPGLHASMELKQHGAMRSIVASSISASLCIVGFGLALAGAQGAAAQSADRISLRLGGKEIALPPAARERVTALAREIVDTCGPNTLHHAGNFGPLAAGVEERLAGLMQRSRLHVAFAGPLMTRSHLGGELPAAEAVIGLEEPKFFVGPTYMRHGGRTAEHLQCGYLASLELACMAELDAHLPLEYRATCARLQRGEGGRIVMPPPDIAPSCS